jgi:nucleotide-binding universal stress UspA family protein
MNMQLQLIVIGVDFSPPSMEAARWTAQHFQNGVELILVNVVADEGGESELALNALTEQAGRKLRESGESMFGGRTRVEVRSGNPARSLADITAEIGADLLVVGARGERAGLERALGTTAQYVVRESKVPVLVVASPGEHRVSSILVPVDDDETARESLRWAALLSNLFGAKVTTFHVDASGALSQAASPQSNPKPAAPNGGKSERWSELARASGISPEKVTSEEAFGVPAAEITSAAERGGADIIVMGRKSAGGLRRAVMGSVTATVLGNPPCSVLVVAAS